MKSHIYVMSSAKTPLVVLGHVSLVRVDILDRVALAWSTGRRNRMGTTAIAWHDNSRRLPKGCNVKGFDRWIKAS